MKKIKILPIILLLVGLAFLLGAIFTVIDNVTAAEPAGLMAWVFNVFQFLAGSVLSGLGVWLSLKKDGKGEKAVRITNTGENVQSATGETVNQRQAGRDFYEQVGKIEIHEAPKSEKPYSPLHQLLQPPADFTGREKLIEQLLSDFNSHKGAAISGLTGMGGIGKTALGLEVAHKIAEKYPDAQIFLDLKGTTTPLSAVEIARHVILTFEPAADLRGLDATNFQAAYQSVLHGKKALLFLDNARSADQIAPLTPPETCAMLVTSRWTFSAAGLQNHRVDVMREDEAEKFLLELCPRIGENAPELAKNCGYLPLALRIAGSFLRVNGDSRVENYIKSLADRKKRLETLKESRRDAELPETEPELLATFELSYNALSEENRKHWRMLGVFPATFAATAAQAVWETEESEAINSLGLFRRYSLIEYDEASSRYSLHDLLADFALAQVEEGEEVEARLKHASHYKDVLSAADDLYLEGGENILLGLKLFDIEWDNIRTGFTWVAANSANNADLTKLCAEYPDAGVYVLSLRQHPREKIRWLELSFAASREIGDRRGEGAALGNLGLAYADLGDARKAIEFYEQYLSIAREIGDRRGEGAALGNLGLAYADLGDVNKAIEFYEQALVIDREIGDRRGEAFGSWNLGQAYEKLGELEKAIEAMQVCVDFEREIGHPDAEKDAEIVEKLRRKLR